MHKGCKIVCFIVIFFKLCSGYSQDPTINNNEVKNDSLIVNKYLKISRENEDINTEKSFLYLNKIEAYSKKRKYAKGIFLAKKEKAFIYYNQKKYDLAISQLQKVKLDSIKLNFIEQARFNSLKGVIFQAKEETDSSLFYLNKSLKLYKKTDNSEGIITSLSNIGISLYQAGLLQEALQNFEKAYHLCIKLKRYKDLPTIMSNYAALLVENNRIKEAEKLFKSLFDNNDLNNDYSLKAALLLNWASFQKNKGNDKKAIEWYQKSIAVLKSKNLPVFPNIYIGLGQIYLSENKPSKALIEFYKSLNSNLIYSEKKMTYKGLANAHLKLKTQDSVAFYWTKLNLLTEEKHKEETRNAIAEVQKNVINYKKDFEIQLLTKDNNILVQKNRANKFTILSLILFGLLALSIIFWYKKQQKFKNEQFVKEMNIKKQGLATYALKITQKNQLLYSLKEKVTEIELKNNETIAVLQKEISTSIANSVHNDKDWEQFEVYFNDIYQGFYIRLKEKFSELTDNDLRVCSLVKLRFTTKEISSLLFLSTETIKSTRYRIRKKINLSHKENLTDFLNKI